MSGRGLTVITMPQPTANGPLHVGHLSGPYIAADIAARAARSRGAEILVSTGLDIHQNYVLVRAQREGISVEKMMDDFRSQITETYKLAGIGYDTFTDPLEPGHDAAIDQVARTLVESGAVPMTDFELKICASCGSTLHQCYVTGRCSWCRLEAAGGACEGCGAFTSAQDLIDPKCNRCGGHPRTITTTLPVLRMESYREQLSAMWLRAELPSRVRQLIGHHLGTGLPDVPIAYPTDWGIPGTGPLAGLRIDPYTEVSLTDLVGIAGAIDPGASNVEQYLAAWKQVDELWHFHGMDNSFWYALYWPAVYAALGMDPLPLAGVVANEFYTLSGLKFSTSRNHAIWANEILAGEDPRIVRLYLAWDRPDRYASDFTPQSFAAFRDRVAPLLAGALPARELTTPLKEAERQRSTYALHLRGFDPALAARGLLTLLEAGDRDISPLRRALTGE